MGKNVVWHEGKVTREKRGKLLGYKNKVVWFTGMSGSGKSTIARELEHRLYEKGILSYVLDGDNIRHGLNEDLGFSAEDREENIRRIGEVTKLFYEFGVFVFTCFISPYRKDRDRVRKLIGEDFVEIYVKCPLSVCEERDPKKLYEKARKGEIKNFTGIDAPYEEPRNAEITLETEKDGQKECVDKIMEYLKI